MVWGVLLVYFYFNGRWDACTTISLIALLFSNGIINQCPSSFHGRPIEILVCYFHDKWDAHTVILPITFLIFDGITNQWPSSSHARPIEILVLLEDRCLQSYFTDSYLFFDGTMNQWSKFISWSTMIRER